MGPAPRWEKAGRERCADPGDVACCSGSFQRHGSSRRLPTLVRLTPALTGTWRALTLPPAAPTNVLHGSGSFGCILPREKGGRTTREKKWAFGERSWWPTHKYAKPRRTPKPLYHPLLPPSHRTLLPPEHHPPPVRVPYARWKQDKDAPQLQPVRARKGQTNCRHQSSRVFK